MGMEVVIENKVKAWAKARGILVLKLNLLGNTGWPDRVFLHLGHIVFIEFKIPGEVLRRNQPERVAELRRRGFTVGVIDNVDDGVAFLEATILSEGWRKARS